MGGLGLISLLESFSPFSIMISVGNIKKQRLSRLPAAFFFFSVRMKGSLKMRYAGNFSRRARDKVIAVQQISK